MEFPIEKYREVASCFSKKISLRGKGDTAPPWSGSGALNVETLRQIVEHAADLLPVAYRDAYVGPLLASLGHVVHGHAPSDAAMYAEALVGAVHQHAEASGLQREVRQFLAVVSNFYRSFLSKAKRQAVDSPYLGDFLPPLATFMQAGDRGPFTLPGDMVRMLCGAGVGVVCLPQTYRFHPICWLTLAHETGGHDVLHADPGLLPELVTGIRSLFGGGPLTPGVPPGDDQLQALIWSYWIDEVASDVYAILNSGPMYVYNMAAFMSAIRNHVPRLATDSQRPSRWNDLDEHPVDLLRLHVAVGVVESLSELSFETRSRYVKCILALAKSCTGGATAVSIRGRIEVERDHWVDIDTKVSLSSMALAARRVGSYIVTANLEAFRGRSIQEIETWSAGDDLVSREIAKVFADSPGAPVESMGDDAQLLAGAMLALLRDPSHYDAINHDLGRALDRSFQYDPIIGLARSHVMVDLPPLPVVPPDAQPQDDARDAATKTGPGAPSLP